MSIVGYGAGIFPRLSRRFPGASPYIQMTYAAARLVEKQREIHENLPAPCYWFLFNTQGMGGSVCGGRAG